MSKLDKREKILLYVLAVVLLAVLPYVYIGKNLISSYKISSGELNVLEQQKEDYNTKEKFLIVEENKWKDLNKEVVKLREGEATINKIYDVHYVFTSITGKNNVKFLSLQTDGPTPFELAGVADNVKEKSKESLLRKPMKLTINLNLEGALVNIMGVVDDINNTGENFVIESFTIGDMNIESKVNVHMTIGIYMVLSEAERTQISGQ